MDMTMDGESSLPNLQPRYVTFEELIKRLEGSANTMGPMLLSFSWLLLLLSLAAPQFREQDLVARIVFAMAVIGGYLEWRNVVLARAANRTLEGGHTGSKASDYAYAALAVGLYPVIVGQLLILRAFRSLTASRILASIITLGLALALIQRASIAKLRMLRYEYAEKAHILTDPLERP